MKLVYLADDIASAALSRRVELMRWGGLDVCVAGYRPEPEARSTATGVPVIDLGAGPPASVSAAAGSTAEDREADAAVGAADIVVARSPAMLARAVRVRRPGTRLVYDRAADEASADEPGRLDPSAPDAVDLVVAETDARALGQAAGHAPRVALLEDKVLALDSSVDDWHLPPLPHEASWVIGWFGDLGCRTSWDLLRTLVLQGRGQIEVLVAGLPVRSLAPDGALSRPPPGITVLENYIAADLPALRASVHFSWMIDHDAGASDAAAALPHDLFANVAHCSIPIALAGSAAGAWLAARGAGVVVGRPATELADLLGDLDDAGYAALVEGIERIPKRDYLILPDEARAFVAAVAGHD